MDDRPAARANGHDELIEAHARLTALGQAIAQSYAELGVLLQSAQAILERVGARLR